MEAKKSPDLQSLHPKVLTDDEFSVYEAEFEKVLNDPLCRNIALSGPYGAGKSSVIETVKTKKGWSEKKWIAVSLATFGEPRKKGESESDSNQDAVEAEILRQMIHKVDISKAPKSSFRKLSDRRRLADAGITFLVLLFVVLTVYFVSVFTELLSFQLSCIEWFAFAMWLVIAGIGLYHLIRSNTISKTLKRIKIFEAELEVTPSSSSSPYERCLDEIVYLLNASEVDVVVFEDLDRFNSIGIFEKMRSLNILANDSRRSGKKRNDCSHEKRDDEPEPLRFFYLMRDGLFKDPHDRTKFFDYIIPVIPYVDPDNALNVMRSALSGVELSVDEEFLYGLSAYIKDPRIIYDIANEAFHYKNALFRELSFDEKNDPKRLIALLVYKAFFPKDFEFLQFGRGCLHEVLQGKERLIASLKVEDKIERNTWRSMTIEEIIGKAQNADALFYFKADDIERKEDFEELSMGDVLNSPFFPMVEYLVSSGCIDASYRRYISNFHSGYLSAEDHDYLSAIRRGDHYPKTTRLKAPDEIVRRMDPEMFTRSSSKDPQIVSALLESDDLVKIHKFMTYIRNANGIHFLADFFASEYFNEKMVLKWMHEYFDKPIEQILSDKEIFDYKKRFLCKYVLAYGVDTFISEDERNALLQYLNTDPNFLNGDASFDASERGAELKAELEEVFKARLRNIGYCPEAINFSSADGVLLDYVYEQQLFMPAPSIVEEFLNRKHGISGSMSRGTLITEALKLPDDSPIKNVVLGKLGYFVSKVVKESGRRPLKDTSECVIVVLNNEDVQAETAERYIDSLENVEIDDVSQIVSSEYQKKLLSAQLVECNANNVISFYRQLGNIISDDLAKLIEAKGAPSDLNAEKCTEAGVDKDDIVSKILKYTTISVANKKLILGGCKPTYSSFDISKLDDETTLAMIETNAIEMNVGMLDKFRVHKSNLTIKYILSDVETFLALADLGSSSKSKKATIKKDEVEGLLESDIDTSIKLNALSCFGGTVRLSEDYEDEVNDAILTQHFDRSDITHLPSYYKKASGAYKDHIAETVAKHSRVVVAEQINLGWDLLCESLKHMKTNREQVLRLLEMFCRQYGNENDRNKITRCFEAAELEDYAKLLGGSISIIPGSIADNAMLSVLVELGMCGLISDDVNAEGLRRVHPKGYKRTK